MDSRISHSGRSRAPGTLARTRRTFRFSTPPRPTPVSLALFAAMGIVPGGALAYDIPTSNNIQEDGRTDTTVDVSGDVTDVTTTTTRGNRAFNSFHHFVVAQGNTVNLHLPDATRHLINLVHDSQAVIDGNLNSLMDGAVGGNVVFADPHGVVVGPNGVLNVGSLLLTTPTQSAMDALIDADGNIDDSMMSDLLKGEVALSDDGAVTIDGQVNANHSARLRAAAISVGEAAGRIDVSVDQDHLDLFNATVNTDDLDVADGVVLEDGVIEIVARNEVTGQNGVAEADASVTVAGELSADNILLSAEAAATATFDGVLAEVTGGVRDLLQDNYDGLPDVDFAQAVANADATVDVQDTADIQAGENLEIDASAERSATASTDASGSYGGVAATFGMVSGETSATIADGAVVNVGGDLALNARSTNTLSIASSTTVDDQGDLAVAATVALGFVDVDTTASILGPTDPGASALQAGTLTVRAASEDSYSVTAEAVGEADGGVGIAASVLDVDTSTLAQLGGNVDADGDILVSAESDVSAAVNRASTGIGQPAGDEPTDSGEADQEQGWVDFLSGLGGDASQASQDVAVEDAEDDTATEKAPGSGEDGGFPLSFGAALALTWLDDSTEALVLEDPETGAAGNTLIRTDGNVTVAARRELAGFANQAVSGAVATTRESGGGGEVAMSAAVAFSNVNTTVSARVGDDAEVEAARLGMLSDYAMPTAVNWGDGDDASAPGSRGDLVDADDSDLEGWLTTWARSETEGSGTVGVAGAVGVQMMGTDVESTIGERALVTLSAEDGAWQTDVSDGDMVEWDAVADVRAVSDVRTLGMTGGTGSSQGVGIGGGINWQSRRTRVEAAVGTDTHLRKSGDGGDGQVLGSLNLLAIRRDSLVTVTDLGGESGGSAGIGVAVGLTLFDGTALTNVAAGAVIDVEGDVSLGAEGETEAVTLVNSAISAGDQVGIAATVAYAGLEGVTEASLLGAETTAGAISVTSKNTNSYTTEADASAKGGIGLGIAAAIAEADMNALVRVGGEVESAGDILAFALNDTTGSKVKAGTKVSEADSGDSGGDGSGDGTADSDPDTVSESKPAEGTTGFVTKRQENKTDQVETKADQGQNNDTAGGTANLKFAAAAGLSLIDQSADVRVEDGTTLTANDGDVVLAGYLRDKGVQTHATAGAKSTVDDNGTAIAVSAAVALGFHENSAAAVVGEGVTITAGRIGIGADVGMPLASDLSWGDFLKIQDVYNEFKAGDDTPLLDKLTAAMRGYASATVNTSGGGDGLAFGGAVNYAQLDNNAEAWVGAGSTLTATETVDGNGWQTDLSDSVTLDWDAAADVVARSDTRSLEVAGNISSLFDLSASSAEGGVLVGGAFNWVDRNGSVRAGVGADAEVTADSVRVAADRFDQVVAITPGSGGGASITGVGMVTVTRVGGETLASISNTADVTADTVAVDADQELSVWSLSGALARGENASVGIAVAVNLLEAQTRAWIGGNADQAQDGETITGTAGTVTTADLKVNARTGGSVGSGAVAGAEAASSSSSGKKGLNDRTTDSVDKRTASADSESDAVQDKATANDGALNSSQDKLEDGDGNKPSDSGSGQQKAKTQVALAGGVTVTVGELTTSAEINNADIQLVDGATSTDITLRGITDADLIAVAGGGALARAGSGGGGGHSTAIAGSLALNYLGNTTNALMTGTTVGDGGNVFVEALTAGDLIAVGLGISATMGSKNGIAVAGSGSVGYAQSTTHARVKDSEIDMDGDLHVTAYDRTRMANGGGAIAVGGKGGIGAAVTVGLVDNTLTAEIDGGRVDGAASVSVDALSGTQVLGGAASVGVVTGSDGAAVNGAVVFHQIESAVTASIHGDAQVGMTDQAGSVAATASGTSGLARLDDLVADRETDSQVQFDQSGSTLANPSDAPPEAEGDDVQSGAGEDPDEDYTSDDTQNTDIDAPDMQGEMVVGIAGTISAGGKAAVGLSFAGNFVETEYTASIADADLDAVGGVDVTAADKALVVGLGVGVAGTGKFALTGSATVNEINSSASALIGDAGADHTNVTAGSVNVAAEKGADIYALAGSVAFSGKAGIGIAVGYNAVNTTTEAGVANATLTVEGGDVTVDAASSASIYSAAISGAASGTASIAGSVNINEVGQTVHATVGGSDITADTLTVEAGDSDGAQSARIWSLSGDIKAGGKAAIGGSVAVNFVENDYLGEIKDSTLTVGDNVDVQATTLGEIWTFGVSGGAAGSVAIGLGAATGDFQSNVVARMENTSLSDGTADVLVEARDQSAIKSFAASVQGGGTVAVGGAATVNTMNNTVNAEIVGGADDRRIHGRNVVVGAYSDADIGTIAVGATVSGTVSASGSAATSILETQVTSGIGGGADILAENNVGVFARSDDAVGVVAGAVGFAAAGLGAAGSVTVNVLQGQTEAAITGADTDVIALAGDSGDTLTASTGSLDAPPSGNPFETIIDNAGGEPSEEDFAGQTTPELGAETREVTGVVVDALSLQRSDAAVATGAINADFVGGGTAIAGTINTTVMAGKTRAMIEDATIGDSTDRTRNGDVNVVSGHHSYGTSVVLGLAAGSVGVSGAVTADVFEGSALSRVRNADVYSGGDLNVDAVSNRRLLGASVGLSVGTYAGATATGGVTYFRGSTIAEIDGSGRIDTESVGVSADSTSSQDLVTVGLAASLGGAVSGAFAVAVSENTTEARIGVDGTGDNGVYTAAGGDVSVDAENTTNVGGIVATAAVGSLAVSGAVSTMVVSNDTLATVENAHVRSGRDVLVNATDNLNLRSDAGGIAAGMAGGVGLGVNVGVIKSNTRAVLDNSDVGADRHVKVKATRNGDLTLRTYLASVGYSGVGISGAVGVLLFGDELNNDLSDDADGDLSRDLTQSDSDGNGDWLGKTSDFTSDDYLTGEGGEDLTSGTVDDPSSLSGKTSVDMNDRVYGNDVDSTTAEILGGSVNAGHTVEVKATDSTTTSNFTLAASGGLVGAGGAVSVTQLNSNVGAQVTPVTLDASVLDVGSEAKDGAGNAVNVEAVAGAAGLVGLGAAVAVADYNANVTTLLGGKLTLSGSMNASATESATVNVSGLGAAAGAAAAGVVVSLSDRTSNVATTVRGDADISGYNLTAGATADGRSMVKGQAAAGGIFGSGTGAGIDALDNTTVKVTVADGAQLRATNNLKVTTLAMPRLSAEALTASISGGYSVGANVVLAEARTDNQVNVEGSALLKGRNVTVSARTERGGWDSVTAKALGISGGILAGVNATVADAKNLTQTRARVQENVTIDATGDVAVTARSNVSQYAEADGYAFGALAAGANVATATANALTLAVLDGTVQHETDSDGVVVTQPDDVDVTATSETRNRASSTAGSGGVVAGSASTARTRDTSTTQANLQMGAHGNALWADTVGVTANHTSNFDATVDSTQASLVGMSGAWADNDVDASVTAQVGGQADINTNEFDMLARAYAVKPELSGHTVKSGSGGAFNGAAASSKTDIRFDTWANIVSGAQVNVVGDWRDPGHLTVFAENEYALWDRVKLDAGGAIAVAKGETELKASQSDTTVTVGDGADLTSVGDITLATYTDASINANADLKTYGAAGAAQGSSLAEIDAAHTVEVGGNVTMEALGFLRLHAGRNLDDRTSDFNIRARTDLWNKTAFPVETDPDAYANVYQTNSVTVDGGADLGAVKDVHLYSDEGWLNLYARGVGKDLYREAAEGAINGIGSLVGADEVSLEIIAGDTDSSADLTVTVDGDIRSGIRSHQILHIKDVEDIGGVPTVTDEEKSEGISYTVGYDSLSATLQERLAELYTYLGNYEGSETEEAAFRTEINILERQLEELAREAGLTEDDYLIEVDGETRYNLPRDFPMVLVEVDPIIARPGNIRITGDALQGSGTLDAPGDARIDILNETPAFLQVADLLIPNREGGQITFNDGLVNTVADINARNQPGAVANFSEVNTAENSPAPEINLENVWNPATWTSTGGDDRPLNPDIFIQGDITNLRGSVTVEASYGSVYAEGDIRANTVALSAGRDFVLAYRDGFRHIGEDPRSGQVAGDDPFVIAGNNVVASARFLNINGLIQSGIDDWTVVIDDSVEDKIDDARARYRNGETGPIVGIEDSDPSEGRIGFAYDFTPGKEGIVLDMVEVRGGYMELTGQIMNTGGGELRVIDGYGRVSVENQTDMDLRIAGIDVGNEIEGTIRLNDTGRNTSLEDGALWSTIFTRVGNSIQTYQGRYNEIRRTSAYQVDNADGTTSRNTHYAPRPGLDFVWLSGQTEEVTVVETYYSDTAIGFIPSGSGTLYSRDESIGDEQPIDGAEYVWRNLVGDRADRDGTPSGIEESWTETVNIDEDSKRTRTENWTTCETRVIVCVEERQWQRTTTTYGQKRIFRNAVQADYEIPVEFTGYDAGDINVNSVGNIILAGSVINPTGTVGIDTDGAITQASDSAMIAADTLDMNAGLGIGDMASHIRTRSTGTLTATTTAGDINLYGVQGDMNVGVVSTGDGDVRLDTQNSILGTGAGHRIAGDEIDLTARQGGIGGASTAAWVNIETGAGDDGLFNAEAQQGVHVREGNGDIRIDRINAHASDVTVWVDDGDIKDANTSEERDDRALEDLQGLWADMGLTGGDADAALDRELEAQANAGTAAYKRYWRLRGLRVDDNGDYVADAYEPDTQAELTAAERDYYANVNGWTQQEINDFEATRLEELEDLHARFGGLGDYDESFSYTLSDAEVDEISAGHAWTSDQLQFSISQGLFNRTTNTSTSIEDPNIVGNNVRLAANKVGTTLDEDVVIDLSAGIRGLSENELVALSTAEYDDISFDDDDLEIIRIRQIEDMDVEMGGHVDVLADQDIFLGSTDNIRLYSVNGSAVRIGTNGAIETARPGDTVLWGDRAILEASDEYVGTDSAPVMSAITGELTVRTDGGLHLINQGDLLLDRVRALDSVDITVDGGSLTAAREAGEAIASDAVNLDVSGDIGSAGQRLNIELGTGSGLVDISAGGSVWLGAEWGPMLTAGDLRLGDSDVGGDYDIADAAHVHVQGEVTVDGDARMDADRITARGDSRLDVTGGATLTTVQDIGEQAAPMQLAVGSLDADSQDGNIYVDFLQDVNGGDLSAMNGEIVMTGNQDVALDSVFAGTDILVDPVVGHFAAGDMGTSSGEILVQADSAAIENAHADTELRVTTTGEQTHSQLDPDADGTLSAGKLVRLHAEDDIRFRNAVAGYEDDVVSQGGDVDLDSATGDIYGNYIFASRDIRAFAVLGGLYITRLDYGNEFVLHAGRDIAIGVGKTFDSSTGSIFAGRNIEIAVGGIDDDPGHILLGGIEARDGHIILDAAGDIRVAVSEPPPGETGVPTSGSMRAGTYVDLTAGGDIHVENTLSSDGDQTMTAGGDITAGRVQSGGTLDGVADGGMDLGLVSAVSDVDLRALDDIVALVLDAGGNQVLSAGGAIDFSRLHAGGDVQADAGGDITGELAEIGGDAAFTAGMDNGAPVTPASIGLGRLQARNGVLTASDTIALDEARIAESLELWADTIGADVIHEPGDSTDPLRMLVAGPGSGTASETTLTVDAANGLHFDRMHSLLADIDTTASDVEIPDGYTEHMKLRTATSDVWMNNLDATAVDWDVQLYQPDLAFTNEQSGRKLFTDAYVIRFASDHDVQVPNFASDHKPGGPEVDGRAADRDAQRALMHAAGTLSNVVIPTAGNTAPEEPVGPGDDDDEAGAVNLSLLREGWPANLVANAGVNTGVDRR